MLLALMTVLPSASALAVTTEEATQEPVDTILIPLLPLPEGDAGTEGYVACGGFAPLSTQCSTAFYALSYLQLSTGGTFNGQMTVQFVGAYGSYVTYRLQVVSGLIVTYSREGPGVYAGTILMGASTSGYFGFLGGAGGVGNWEARVTYY